MWAISFSVVLTFVFSLHLFYWIFDKIDGGAFGVKILWFSLVAFFGYMAGQS